MAGTGNKRKASGDGARGDDASGSKSRKPASASPSAPLPTASTNHPDKDNGRHLPPSIWGNVLNFLPYADVQTTFLVCKSMINEATAHITALNICTIREMHAPAIQGRLRHGAQNIAELNLFCLLQYAERNEWDEPTFRLRPDAVPLIVPFASCFPNLTYMFLGCIVPGRHKHMVYVAERCVGPDNHVELMRGLVDSVCGALRVGALPGTARFEIDGLWSNLDAIRPCADVPLDSMARPCNWCRKVCRYLPPLDVIYMANPRHYVCVGNLGVYKIVASRPNGREALEDEFSCKILIQSHVERVRGRWRLTDLSSKEKSDLLDRLGVEGVDRRSFHREGGSLFVCFISKKNFELIDELLDLGFSPKNLSKAEFYRYMQMEKKRDGWDDHDYDVWTKAAIHGLVARGFPLDPEDFVIVDEATEPAFEKLRNF